MVENIGVIKVMTSKQLDEFIGYKYGSDKNEVLGILWDAMFQSECGKIFFSKARANYFGRLYDHVLKNWK